ncbi:uncharacterized protein LOC105664762 [Ceratitis capitata]|uniref:(Mediterranean fruit fly) hypothetical protein n=1 Tax=Ceratitis capitata TaxID=7213 RepID=A0A811UZ74_CERCA|nr:uncharacterized protein LOC105664762 [Ceratitis capitata]XP_020713907.1 uncharacterized protein LOC105664762 [Ceratitis capitata]CAD7004529.1 unnamed protein product [Ceratitis capitata]
MIATLVYTYLLICVLMVAEVSSNQLHSFVKLKNIQCRTSHPDLVSLEECRILDKSNESKVQTLCYFKERPINQINLRMKSYIKRPVGYVPFVIYINVDWCDFLVKRNNVILKRLFNLVEKYSNMHTTCPIDQDYIYLNASLGKNRGFYLPFRFPLGEYRLDFLTTFNLDIKVATYVYFEVE